MTHFPTRYAHLSIWSIDQVFHDLPLGCKLFPAFWRVVAQILRMSPALCRPIAHQEPRAIKTAQNSNDSKNLWTRKRELRGKRCKYTVSILLQLLREDWSISWRLCCGNLKLWHLRIISPDPGLPDYCPCAYMCALSHTRSLPLPGFQGQQNHSYLLPLPSSPQGSLRKQQELWGKQLRLSRRWHHPPAQKGLSRASGRHGCWPTEVGSCGIRGVLPSTGGGGRALAVDWQKGISAQSPQPPSPPQFKRSETRPWVGPSSQGSRDTSQVNREKDPSWTTLFCALPWTQFKGKSKI